MLFWIREIAGWLLVLFSLYLIRLGISFVADPAAPRIVEASVIMFTATGVLRVGILLIRVSTAARIVQRETVAQRPEGT